MKLHFVWMENNWKLIPDQSRVEPVNFSSHPHACERTSRSSWQSLAAWEAPELKSADFLIYVAILLYAFPFVCLPFLCWSPLLLVGGGWKVGRKKGSTSKRDGGEELRTGERSTHIYRFSFRLYTLPRCPQKHKARSLRLYQHGAMLLSMGMMLTLNGENEKTTELCACVRGRKENKKRRRNYVLKFLYVELRWWVERVEASRCGRRPSADVNRDRNSRACTSDYRRRVGSVVSRLSSFKDSRSSHDKRFVEIGVGMKDEAAILISSALRHKMIIVITSTRAFVLPRRGISATHWSAMNPRRNARSGIFLKLRFISSSFAH